MVDVREDQCGHDQVRHGCLDRNIAESRREGLLGEPIFVEEDVVGSSVELDWAQLHDPGSVHLIEGVPKVAGGFEAPMDVANNPAADAVEVLVGISVDLWSPGRQLLPFLHEALHEIPEELASAVSRLLEGVAILLHQHREDVVPLQTF